MTMSFGRRRFLKGAGGALLALPFLPSVAMGAQGARNPKRFVAIFSANGQHDGNWYPTQPIPWVEKGRFIRECALTDIPGPISKVLGSEFDRHRRKMVLIRGLDNPVLHENTHIATKMLSGFGEAQQLHVTIDQVMARSKALYQTEPWMRSLNVVVDGQSEMKYLPMSVMRTGNGVAPVVPYTDPGVVLQKLFPAPIDRSSKQSVIDAVAGELKVLLSNRRLSAVDRSKLDQHLALVREVEKQALPPAGNTSARPTLLRVPDRDERHASEVIRNYATLIATAIKCDLCRVFAFQLAHTQEQRSFGWLTGVSGSNHHDLTHADNPVPLVAINQWYAMFVAEFLTQLDTIEDDQTGATYLDNSLVFWGNESGVYDITKGNPHYNNDMQVALFGSAGGRFKTNRFINFQRPQQKIIMFEDGRHDMAGPDLGRPYNELLITLMTSLGLTHAEWESGEEPGFGDYRVNLKGQYDFGDRRSPLPGF